MRTDSASEYTLQHLHGKEKHHQCPPEAGEAESSTHHLMLSRGCGKFMKCQPKVWFEYLGLPFMQDLYDTWCNMFPRGCSEGWGRQQQGKLQLTYFIFLGAQLAGELSAEVRRLCSLQSYISS